MPWTAFTQMVRRGRIKSTSILVSLAVCTPLAATSGLVVATSVLLQPSTAHACGIVRRIHNKTAHDMYVEIWRGRARRWVATEPTKPGGTLTLEYVKEGEVLLVAGPKPARDWETNSLGVILEVRDCEKIFMQTHSKHKGYKVGMSTPTHADIYIYPDP